MPISPGLEIPIEGMITMLILIPLVILAAFAFGGLMKMFFWILKGR